MKTWYVWLQLPTPIQKVMSQTINSGNIGGHFSQLNSYEKWIRDLQCIHYDSTRPPVRKKKHTLV